jgi:hypothetical protein
MYVIIENPAHLFSIRISSPFSWSNGSFAITLHHYRLMLHIRDPS